MPLPILNSSVLTSTLYSQHSLHTELNSSMIMSDSLLPVP